MKEQIIRAALAFLDRAQLSAQEIDAFTAVRNALIAQLPQEEAPEVEEA